MKTKQFISRNSLAQYDKLVMDKRIDLEYARALRQQIKDMAWLGIRQIKMNVYAWKVVDGQDCKRAYGAFVAKVENKEVLHLIIATPSNEFLCELAMDMKAECELTVIKEVK